MSACANIAVKSPDGNATATYKGTVLLGDEGVSCGSTEGVNTCTVTGRDIQGIAQAIMPLVAKYFGLPSGSPPVAAAPAPAPAAQPATIPSGAPPVATAPVAPAAAPVKSPTG